MEKQLAVEIATEITGHSPINVRRFTTGMRHYVFDVEFACRKPIVARIGAQSARAEIAGAVYLSQRLRPLGVPLPELLASNVGARLLWMALERLRGTDLGEVVRTLSFPQLDEIASQVARAQAITAEIGASGRYGYAVRADQAPCDAWSAVLEANLSRAQVRIASAGLFDVSKVEIVRTLLAGRRAEIDRIEPTAFLHDTTTKNVIVGPDGAFSGIVDVDDLCFGDPRYPIALTLAALLARGDPTEYISAWLGHSDQPDDATFRLYVLIFLLDFMSEHGQSFNGNERASSPEIRSALYSAFEESLRFV